MAGPSPEYKYLFRAGAPAGGVTYQATPEGTLTYTYDLAVNLVTLYSGTSVANIYDARTRLSMVSEADTRQTRTLTMRWEIWLR